MTNHKLASPTPPPYTQSMDELIKKILALPPITLSDKEWAIAIATVESLIKNKLNEQPENLRDDLKLLNIPVLFTRDTIAKHITKNNFRQSKRSGFLDYIEKWEDLTRSMALWTRQIFELWSALFKKPMSLEDFFPTLVELFTTDKNELKKIHHALSIAMRFCEHIGAIQAVYLSFLTIAESLLKNPADETPDNEQKRLQRINTLIKNLPNADEIIFQFRHECREEKQRLDQIETITKHCDDYKKHIIKSIKKKINEHLTDESSTDENIDATLFILINKNNNPDTKFITSKETLVLFDKFIAISDLLATCQRDMRSESILDEFSAKYNHYQEILEKDSDDLGIKILKTLSGFLILEQLYIWLSKPILGPSAVEQFNQTTRPFAENHRLFKLPKIDLEVINPARLFKKTPE